MTTRGRIFFGLALAVLGANFFSALWNIVSAGSSSQGVRAASLLAGTVFVSIFFLPAWISAIPFSKGRASASFLFLEGALLLETLALMPFVTTMIHADALGGISLWLVSAAHLITAGAVIFLSRRSLFPRLQSTPGKGN